MFSWCSNYLISMYYHKTNKTGEVDTTIETKYETTDKWNVRFVIYNNWHHGACCSSRSILPQTCNQPIYLFIFCFDSSQLQVLSFIDHSWTLKCSMCTQIYVLIPKYSGLLFFFSLPVAGLTNWHPVRDSNPGAPLVLSPVCCRQWSCQWL